MERTVDILIEISIYSAVITAFILLFRAAFKKRISPKVQYAMWLLLVLRLMLPVTIESGFHVESLLPEWPAPVVQEESIFEAESPVISEIPAVNMAPVADVAPVQPDLDTQGEEFTPAISQEIPESTVVAVPEVKEPIIDINWRIVAFWAWITGAMAFGLWMMIVKLRFYEDMHSGLTSVSPRVYAIYDECCASLKVKPITLWAVDRAISPGIAFFTYPVLLLPASMDGDEEKLRYAFLHELTHKKRRDHYMTGLLTALRVIYWFNPAVHIGFSEMRSDMETACDADVIAFVGKEQKRGYLSSILELFSYATRPQLGMSQASSRRMAKRRMKGAFMRERTTFLGRAAALMLAVIMLVGCFTTACQSAPAEVEEVSEEIAETIELETTPQVNLDEVKTEVWKENYIAGGWLPVTVDVEMDIPLYVNYPVYNMEYYGFTSGKLKHMADKLLGAPSKVVLLNDYSEGEESTPLETELSPNGQYMYVDANGQDWAVRAASQGMTIQKHFPDGALIQTEETVMHGEAYPGEPAGSTIDVQMAWQEAYQHVSDAMDKLGIINMVPVNHEKARLIDSSNQVISTGWYFILSREEGGRTTFYNDKPHTILMDFEDPIVPLNKEVIRVFVDETGIENIMWNHPSNASSIITDTRPPLTFEETKQSIKNALEQIAKFNKGKYSGDHTITIEDIDLRSCPVQSEAGISTGYLLPAWVIELVIGEGDSANNRSWLCISTIDGSVISQAYMTEAGKRIAQEYDSGMYVSNTVAVDQAEPQPTPATQLQPTPSPTPTPAPATGEHAWRAGKLAIEPYRDNDTSLLELSHYGITLSGNGTEQTESMRESKVSNDVYSRDGQELLEVMRVPRGTLKLDIDLIQHSAENVQWNSDSETYGAVEYTPTWLPGHNGRVLRMTRRYERGTEDSIPYVTTIYSVQIQYNNSDVVLMFRFLNAKKINGEWQLYQTDYDCEKWMRTFQIDGATNSIVANAQTLVGKPYKKGTYGPDTFDSAGLVYYVLTQEGINVERWDKCQGYADYVYWQKIEDKANLQPGDILFFHGDDTERIQHAGIYIGDNKMIDASSSAGKVTERSWDTNYWNEHFAFARRII